ncbi:MAG: tetratricopeptide repeat protein [Oceanihabitans sp.]
MKKQVILILTLAFSVITFAQKKELKTVEKAIKSNNFAEAKATLSTVESMLSSMDDKTKAKYYFLKGKALYANGAGTDADIDSAIENFNKVTGSYKDQVTTLKQEMTNSILTTANNNYKSSNFTKAAKGFAKLYKIIPTDTSYLYYAASSAFSGEDYESALKHYVQLNDLGYTGEVTQYFATSVDTGEEEMFDQKTRDLYIRSKSYIKPVEKKSKSKTSEIIKQIAFLYLKSGKDKEALAAIKQARENEPEDINLLMSEANLYHKTGDLEAYRSLMEEAVAINPDNVDLIFNLGVISMQNKDTEKAKEYYQKVIDRDPSYVNAQTNMAALILEEEEALNQEMNGLGNSAADDKRYSELKEAKRVMYTSAVPYLEKVLELQPSNISVAKSLLSIYSAIDDTAKYDAVKKIVDALTKE